jgi:sugar lactone lactonase YvrE
MVDRDRMPVVAVAARARLGEGPIWDDRAGALRWVDIYNRRVHAHDPLAGTDRFAEVEDVVTAIALTRDDSLLLCLRDRIVRYDPRSGTSETLHRFDLAPGDRLNDGKVDPTGRFWIGTASKNPGDAALFRYDPDGTVRQMEEGLTISNGLDWSPDGRTFYLTDSPEKRIHAYDFDPAAGTISNRRVLIETSGDPVPDGLTVDSEGFIWSALWEGGEIVRYSASGREVGRVALPVPLTTSCTFGGEGLRDLYVTSASVGLSQDEVDEAAASGDVFVLRNAGTGLPAARFGVGRG